MSPRELWIPQAILMAVFTTALIRLSLHGPQFLRVLEVLGAVATGLLFVLAAWMVIANDPRSLPNAPSRWLAEGIHPADGPDRP